MPTLEPTLPMFTVHRHIRTGKQRTVETGGGTDRHLRGHPDWVTTTLGKDSDAA